MADKFKMVNDKLIKLTSNEISEREKDAEENKKLTAESRKKLEDKETKKTSATTKLKKLGLTDDEIKALIGG
tara:strand:- start:2086 stop:2301 length:216 start_codon:yes stop_codon:yes gene_type:complete